MLCVGDKVKITKGTHKSKWGHILIIKDSFIQVKVVHYIKSKANGDSDDLIETKTVRAKKEFVEKIPDVVVEMPTAENLQPVFEFPEQKTDQEIVKEILDAMPDPPANDEDILSQHDENDPVDITGLLPTIDEALDLRKQVDIQSERIAELESRLTDVTNEKNELKDSCEMFLKLAEFVKVRIQNISHDFPEFA
jgi:glutamine synthetase adenylyltransferase